MLLARKNIQIYIQRQKQSKKGWTQQKFAGQIGCSSSYISELVNGKKSTPSIKFARQLEVATKGRVKLKDWCVEVDKD